jgi:hypothetical protein
MICHYRTHGGLRVLLAGVMKVPHFRDTAIHDRDKILIGRTLTREGPQYGAIYELHIPLVPPEPPPSSLTQLPRLHKPYHGVKALMNTLRLRDMM